MTHNGQESGSALADVLFGDFNPAGRLVQTWPRSLDQLPPMMDYDIRHGRTYQYFKGRPLYPFGHGLSYTRFRYSDLQSPSELPGDGSPSRFACISAMRAIVRETRCCSCMWICRIRGWPDRRGR